VHVIAGAYEFLKPQEHDSRIEIHQYLEELCKRLGDTLRDIRPIAVLVDSERMELASDRAVAIGLIVNELVTNAFKYAFSEERSGVVRVSLKSGPKLTLVVEDDGRGCPDQASEGIGSRLIRLLVLQLDGTIARASAQPGCRVTVTVKRQ
jgi:two-component sensor histidine kinase